ncbi:MULTISPECIES: hypothetical protein [unclassified Halomonas]|uniref:hypothetical protein n=1 Tax=unclassified Halomonas TaxID=2609666 RepID=UPI0021E49C2E|nr:MULTISPECIES: hypothetical protein [unclassified Halomonas]UYF98629.1 hypothetical protein OCT39_10320 [Halomonas sp. GD1P12]WNL40257.1 hypothetical protein RN346_06755 [Halomonas sp. PAMB 3232]
MTRHRDVIDTTQRIPRKDLEVLVNDRISMGDVVAIPTGLFPVDRAHGCGGYSVEVLEVDESDYSFRVIGTL